MLTPAVDVLLAGWRALSSPEQDELFNRISDLRLARIAGEESEVETLVRGLRRVAGHLGHTPTVEEYRSVRAALITSGEALPPLSRLIRFFGSWRAAREALELSETNTPRMIQERFRKRRLGKVWRYTETTLGDVLARCAKEYQRPPLVVEFECWRDRELELAQARGDMEFHLPSSSPYRRRWGTWEKALLYFGYPPEEVAARLEPGRALSNRSLEETQFRKGPCPASAERGHPAPNSRSAQSRQ